MNDPYPNNVQEILGCDTILLPIPRGKKGPKFKGWQTLTLETLGEDNALLDFGDNRQVTLQDALGLPRKRRQL